MCALKRHILVLNSYPDHPPPPPLSEILYPPLLDAGLVKGWIQGILQTGIPCHICTLLGNYNINENLKKSEQRCVRCTCSVKVLNIQLDNICPRTSHSKGNRKAAE